MRRSGSDLRSARTSGPKLAPTLRRRHRSPRGGRSEHARWHARRWHQSGRSAGAPRDVAERGARRQPDPLVDEALCQLGARSGRDPARIVPAVAPATAAFLDEPDRHGRAQKSSHPCARSASCPRRRLRSND